jgi:MFS family permease
MIFPNIAASWSRIFYGWRMIGLVSAIRVVGGGIHQYGFTVFFLPISQDLGMSRAATSLAFSLARAQGAIEAPLVGYLIDRFGPRPIIVTAAFLAGAGYILLSWVESYASFLIVYLAVISLAFIAGFVHSPMVIANSWFIRQRARAMTVVSGGRFLRPQVLRNDSRHAEFFLYVGKRRRSGAGRGNVRS